MFFFRVLARTSAFSRSPSARIALELLSNAPMEPASRAAVRVCSPFFFWFPGGGGTSVVPKSSTEPARGGSVLDLEGE